MRDEMTSRSDFNDDEWARLGRAPLLAGLAVSLSDAGGPIELVKESRAALKTVLEAAREGSFGQFVQSVADDVAAKAKRRENPLAGFSPDRRRAGEEILDELRSVYALLVAKAGEEDVEDYREWVRTASQRRRSPPRKAASWGSAGPASASARSRCSRR